MSLARFSGLLLLFSSWIPTIRGNQSVQLAWDPSTAPNVAGYRLYAGTTSGVYTQTIEVGNNTATLVSNLIDGTTYFFAVTDYATSGLESTPSNEVSYRTSGTAPTPSPGTSPAPTPRPTPTPAPMPHIGLSVSPSTITEGSNATFTVATSTVNPTVPTIVNYSLKGKAILGMNYVMNGIPGQVTIPAGQSSATVTLTALTTATSKSGVSVTLSITPGPNYKSSSKKGVSVRINNIVSPASPTPAPTPPPAPVLLSAVPAGPGSVTLQWSENDTHPGSFRILYGTSPGNVVNPVDVTGAPATVTGLSSGTYYFVVKFFDIYASGPSAASNQLSVTVP